MTDSRIRRGEPAHLGWRLAAAAYDLLPLLALWFAATGIALAATGGALDVRRLRDKLIVQALVLLLGAAYFAASWWRGGQTIGMRPWRLRVVRADGTAPELGRCLLRFAVALASLAAVGAGFWWALFDPQRRTWHDIAAGTVMVRVERRET
jgi:uncharacterized RDD family membrane protein YckC